jgi:hypothetical protein
MRASSLRLGLVACALAVAGFLGFAEPARAIAFTQITNNSGVDYSADFSATVSDAGGGKVLITFTNAPGGTGFIGAVYIDDDDHDLVAIALDPAHTIGGVTYQIGASPGNLPAGNTASPPFAADFSAGKQGAASNGVDAGETLALLGTLASGVSAADLLADAQAGRFRLGIHAQSLGPNQQSESFVDPPEVVSVPEPKSAGLLAIGLIALLTARRGAAFGR